MRTRPIGKGIGRALGTWLAFVVAVALLKPLGFVLSLALLSFFLVTVIFRRSPVTAAITAGAIALGFHLTFPVALGVQLPVGLLGI
jgi:putative tricarboxylic transport membrane protein